MANLKEYEGEDAFYAINNKVNTAEQLYTEAIKKMEKTQQINYSLLMAKNLLGRLLSRDDGRKEDAFCHLQ